jgi:hypothetical protein
MRSIVNIVNTLKYTYVNFTVHNLAIFGQKFLVAKSWYKIYKERDLDPDLIRGHILIRLFQRSDPDPVQNRPDP